MSLSSENMMKLMAYADGELEGDERKEAEKLLATDPDSMRFVEQIGGLGDLVELGHEDRSAKSIAKFDIADAVMALAKDTPKDAAEKSSNVSSLAAAREKRAERAERASGKGSSLKIGAGIVAALALAASIFLVAQHRTDETPMAKGPSAPPVQANQPVQANPASTVATNSPGGVDVSTVNSPGNSVSVFYLPTANELSTSVVVWVDETGEK
jgi:anti-sigma factor RsiW